jgi:hypothetical protein
MQSIRKLDFERHMALMHRQARDGNYWRHDIDEEQLKRLNKLERRFLSRRCCAGCDHPLDRTGCGTYGGMPPCTWRGRLRRRRNCLKTYKPRQRRAA